MKAKLNELFDKEAGFLMILFLMLTPWIIGCSSDNGTATNSTTFQYSQTDSFGPQGGTLELQTPAGLFRLIIPADALDGEQNITMGVPMETDEITSRLGEGFESRSEPVSLLPHGLSFKKPVEIHIPHSGSESVLSVQVLHHPDDLSFETVTGTSITDETAHFETAHFSTYVVTALTKPEVSALGASTTNFSFGQATACGCNGQAVVDAIKAQPDLSGWGGVATPEWMGTPYLGAADDVTDKNNCANPALKGTKEYRNCAAGFGGCGTCWKFTTTGEANIYGDTAPGAGRVAYGVVLDNCEASNAYGNNQQWCVPYSNVAQPCNAGKNACYDGAEQNCPGADQVLGSFEATGAWNPGDDCGNLPTMSNVADWECTNLAAQATHFDFAIDQANNVPWSSGDNPVVTAEPIKCPDAVISILKANCGSNAPVDCFDYCNGQVPSYWPKCEPLPCACTGCTWDNGATCNASTYCNQSKEICLQCGNNSAWCEEGRYPETK